MINPLVRAIHAVAYATPLNGKNSRFHDQNWSTAYNANSKALDPSFYLRDPFDLLPLKIQFSHRSRSSSSSFTACLWYSDCRRVLAASSCGDLLVFQRDLQGVEDVKKQPRSSGAITCMTWLQGARHIVLGDQSGDVHVAHQNLARGGTASTGGPCVTHVVGSPCGTKFVAVSADTAPIIFDVGTITTERVITECGYDTAAIDWHPKFSLLACGSKSEKLTFWDPRTCSQIYCLMCHKGAVTASKFNPANENLLASAARDNVIKLIDIRTMGVLREFINYGPLPAVSNIRNRADASRIVTLEWSPCGSALVTGDGSGCVTFWNGKESASVNLWAELDYPSPYMFSRVLQCHDAAVNDFAFHPLGDGLISCGADGAIHVWSSVASQNLLKLSRKSSLE